ncbi:MAG: FprA family A-type flavoprotein [Candidatus Cryptobacteroides sp.]
MSKLTETIRYVGVNDTAKTLFEGLWPLPKGVTYNSYLVFGEKTALIDTAEASFAEEYIAKVKAEAGGRTIDYLIVNHMEPDHSSLLERVREEWPQIRIVTSAKAVPMIAGYYGLTDNIEVVKEGGVLDLGSGVTLQFFMAPMVHWPEVMVTYYAAEKTVFSADAFGTFGIVEGRINDCRFADYRDEMIRYYANIVGKYGPPVQAALKKLSALEVKRLCSTHGPVWEDGLGEVVALYDRLSKYEGERGVCIVYGSMYGNTEKAAEALAASLEEKGIPHALHNLCTESISFALMDAFRFDTIAVGAPTYNNEIFPPVSNFISAIEGRGLKHRRFFAFGSYTWAGSSVRKLNERAQNLGFELISDGISFAQGYSPEKVIFPEFR